ncbi:MAG: asparagine synthase (glutamine-hydrolyzing) [Crocinitomicaceae bacterium]|nr:asparagine synthase (glutamine-hydrolyzing) [Crocinitomicaceae bacterium]
MCGITGIWIRNNKAALQLQQLPVALDKIKHRGPDANAVLLKNHVGLGHARLAVIDLNVSANQPFSSADGKHHLVFNGEIYNYKELKTELESSGLVFKTQSDTEVLLQLLIKYGITCIERLNGFFSFIYYNESANELFAARDRFGIKPLLYYQDEDKFILSSELSAIMAFDVTCDINPKALHDYFTYTYIPAPETILKHVFKLEPGYFIKCHSDGTVVKQVYYQNELKTKTDLNFETAKEKLVDLLSSSVKRRLIADVPLGCFLSGGIDSSVIAALAKEHKSDLNTFSVGFDHPYFDESNNALETAKYLNTHHHAIKISKQEFLSAFDPFLQSLDEPFADSSAFAYYHLSEFAKKHVTVALSGDGADELFGGYRKHRAELQIRNGSWIKKSGIHTAASLLKIIPTSRSGKLGDLSRKIQKYSAGLNMSANERYDTWCSWISSDVRQKLFKSSSNSYQNKNFNIESLNDFLLTDQQFVLPNDMLKKVDQMSMAHALEVRVPFLDHTVLEFANSLPETYKINEKTGKIILRESFRNRLPESLFHRQKKGFEIPLQLWLKDEMEKRFGEIFFTESYIEKQCIFNTNFIMSLKKDVLKSLEGEGIYLIWSLLIFQHWYHQHIHHRL